MKTRRMAVFVFILLAAEFLDEFIYGSREAAWPLIRTDLGLSYEQIGLLLSIPTIIATVIEPALGILGDVWKRRVLILGGGVVFAVAMLLAATSNHFLLLMLAFIISGPASGAFVGLSQSTLMDLDTERHEHNMARWTFAGSLGVVVGAFAIGLGWRNVFFVAALIMIGLVIAMSRVRFREQRGERDFGEGLRDAFRALRRGEVLRCLILLEFADLMLDVLHGYLALYFVDVVRIDPTLGGLAVAVWTGVGLIGDFLLIPLLERVSGLAYLRASAVVELVLFCVFLLVPSVLFKLVILALLGFFNAGWYAILQGQLYGAMPGQSGTVMTLNNVFGFFRGAIPFLIGLAAEYYGLGAAMWLFLLGPIALLVGLPYIRKAPETRIEENPLQGGIIE